MSRSAESRGPASCRFCAIVCGDHEAGGIAFRDAATVVFPNLRQRGRDGGHMIVVPVAHIPNIYQVDRDLGGSLLATVSAVARALKRGWGADGVVVQQNNDEAGGQDVFHLHFHVVPRFVGDRDGPAAVASEWPLPERIRLAERLAAELRHE